MTASSATKRTEPANDFDDPPAGEISMSCTPVAPGSVPAISARLLDILVDPGLYVITHLDRIVAQSALAVGIVESLPVDPVRRAAGGRVTQIRDIPTGGSAKD